MYFDDEGDDPVVPEPEEGGEEAVEEEVSGGEVAEEEASEPEGEPMAE